MEESDYNFIYLYFEPKNSEDSRVPEGIIQLAMANCGMFQTNGVKNSQRRGYTARFGWKKLPYCNKESELKRILSSIYYINKFKEDCIKYAEEENIYVKFFDVIVWIYLLSCQKRINVGT